MLSACRANIPGEGVRHEVELQGPRLGVWGPGTRHPSALTGPFRLQSRPAGKTHPLERGN